ncbi:hypothetical protein RhiirB3_530227 [Rhizophagus irregularis]|nr:hypothetical protein RhiirB3_530227 [Rhizophagus irregularis]
MCDFLSDGIAGCIFTHDFYLLLVIFLPLIFYLVELLVVFSHAIFYLVGLLVIFSHVIFILVELLGDFFAFDSYLMELLVVFSRDSLSVAGHISTFDFLSGGLLVIFLPLIFYLVELLVVLNSYNY